MAIASLATRGGGAPLSLTSNFGELHEDEDGVAEGGADSLGAREEEVVGGHDQSVGVEEAVGVPLLLQAQGCPGVSLCATRAAASPCRARQSLQGGGSCRRCDHGIALPGGREILRL